MANPRDPLLADVADVAVGIARAKQLLRAKLARETLPANREALQQRLDELEEWQRHAFATLQEIESDNPGRRN